MFGDFDVLETVAHNQVAARENRFDRFEDFIFWDEAEVFGAVHAVEVTVQAEAFPMGFHIGPAAVAQKY